MVSTGATGSVAVTTGADCTWTAVSNANSWITVTAGNERHRQRNRELRGGGEYGRRADQHSHDRGQDVYDLAGRQSHHRFDGYAAHDGWRPHHHPSTVIFRQGLDGYAGAVDRTISSMYAFETWNGGIGVTDPEGTNSFELKNDSEYEARPLVKFSGLTLPAGATITSATLTIHFSSWLETSPVVSGYYLSTPWDGAAKEKALNWKYRASSLEWATAGGGEFGSDLVANKSFSFDALKGSGDQARTVTLDPAVVQGMDRQSREQSRGPADAQ